MTKLPRELKDTETELRIGNTTYITAAHYAPGGVTVSQKIKRILDKETNGKSD